MIRFFKYRCPVNSVKHADDYPILATCSYEWNYGLDFKPCSACGKTHEETQTIWDKVQFAYWGIVPYNWRPKNIWYNLQCRFWHRYTTIKPRTLDHTWCDCTSLLPHMMFEILCRFVENELRPSFETINWDSDPEHQHARDEMLALYNWWTKDYKNLPDETWEDDIKNEELLRNNCKRIVDVSPYMWT